MKLFEIFKVNKRLSLLIALSCMVFSVATAKDLLSPTKNKTEAARTMNVTSDIGTLPAGAQQPATVTGTVVDRDGFPLPGVQVMVKGKPGVGTATDTEGRYSIQCSANETLVFSFIGFKPVERIAGEINRVTITLEEDTLTLDEVVVTAFGKQKKESVISAISTVKPSELRVPSSNMTTAFAGRLSGVIAYQRSGEPGADNADFFIRGVTSFSTSGKKDPLILIDGIEMAKEDLSRLNVDDIASFSVLKDASAAALYGSRGANGVILVSTKEGQTDKISVNVRAETYSSSNTKLVEMADPVTYMRLHNEAVRTRDPMAILPYNSYKIMETEMGVNPVLNPSVDWYNYLIKDRTGNQRVNLNVTGGGKAVQYYLSSIYEHETGIIKENEDNMVKNNININRLQVRSNVTIKFSPVTTGMVRAWGRFQDQTGPRYTGAQVFEMARNASPVRFLPFYPKDEANEFTNHILFGNDPEGLYTNPYSAIVSGFRQTSTTMMTLQLELEHKFTGKLEGLVASAMYNTKRDSYYYSERNYSPFFYTPANTLDGSYRLIALNPDSGTEYLYYSSGDRSIISSQYGEIRLSYNTTLNDKHDLSAMFVEMIRTEGGIIKQTDQTKLSDLLQGTLPKRNISMAGKLAYGFDSRYYVEFNVGYNGSERFAKKNRYGFFPTIGGGWMVSNESFMEGISNVVSSLKLKASYGLNGNDAIGTETDRFFYLSQIDMNGVGYWFGSNLRYRTGVNINRYANDLITWEIAYKSNFGMELELFKDLTLLADYFTETRKNILQTRTDIPTTMGLRSAPEANVGVAKGKGFEMELKYQKSFGKDFWTQANGNFTYTSAVFKEYEEPDYTDIPWKSHIGLKLKQQWGYIAERLFVDEEDVNNSPSQTMGNYGAGDIKYRDINNDGIVNSDDMVPIGFPTVPEIIYGAGLSMGYKSFDLAFFFQGSARSSFFISSSAISPFINNGQRGLLQYIADDHWSENNRDIYAFWPRLSSIQVANNNVASTWWLRNGGFLRFKTAEFGYTIPEKLTKKLYMNVFRVYLSGVNLFMWSNFKMWDPEQGGNDNLGNGMGYPIQRQLNVGVNINF